MAKLIMKLTAEEVHTTIDKLINGYKETAND